MKYDKIYIKIIKNCIFSPKIVIFHWFKKRLKSSPASWGSPSRTLYSEASFTSSSLVELLPPKEIPADANEMYSNAIKFFESEFDYPIPLKKEI